MPKATGRARPAQPKEAPDPGIRVLDGDIESLKSEIAMLRETLRDILPVPQHPATDVQGLEVQLLRDQLADLAAREAETSGSLDALSQRTARQETEIVTLRSLLGQAHADRAAATRGEGRWPQGPFAVQPAGTAPAAQNLAQVETVMALLLKELAAERARRVQAEERLRRLRDRAVRLPLMTQGRATGAQSQARD
ncbi:hypothetical protein GC209_17790 [bacterium]|nr:hypothetical protein [bacterium]